MSCWSVNSFDFSREKLHERFSASAVFFSEKPNELPDQQDIFAVVAHLLSIRAITSWKKTLININFEAQTPTGHKLQQEILPEFHVTMF